MIELGPRLLTIRRKPLLFFILLAIILWTVFLRLHSLPEPLHTDICVYSLIGQGMLDGKPLYFTLLDNKPPGIYILFMLVQGIAGNEPAVFVWLGILFTLFSLFLIFFILVRLANIPTALLGTLLWSAVSLTPQLWANQPHTEVFINTFLLLGLAGIICALQGKRKGLWFGGLGFALASAFKTNVFFIFLAMCIFWAASGRKTENPAISRRLGELGILLVPGALLWAGFFLFFILQGTAREFVDIVFRSLHHYAGNILLNEWNYFTRLWQQADVLHNALWLPAVFSFAWLALKIVRRTIWRNADKALVCYFIGCLITIGSIPSHFLHYYQIIIPPLVLFSALFFYEVYQYPMPSRRWQLGFLGLLLAGLLLQQGYYVGRYLASSPDDISTRKYGDDILVADRALGRYLASITKPEDRLYQWGMHAHLNYYSNRKTPAGLIQHHLFFFSPDDVKMKIKNKLVAELTQDPPVLLIFAAWIGDYRETMIYRVLGEKYRYFASFDRYLLFVRRDYPLAADADPALFRVITTRSFNDLGTARLQLARENQAHARREINRLKSTGRDFIVLDEKSRYAELLHQGNQYARNGQWHKAMQAWVRAQAVQPRRPEATANLGIYHEYLGAFYLALDHYEIAFRKLGPPWDNYYRATQRRMHLTAQEQAAKQPPAPVRRRDLAQAAGDDAYARLVQKGNLEAGKSRWQQARIIWEKALHLDSRRPEARANLGIFYEITQEYEMALREYARAAEQLGEPWIHYHQKVREIIKQQSESNNY